MLLGPLLKVSIEPKGKKIHTLNYYYTPVGEMVELSLMF